MLKEKNHHKFRNFWTSTNSATIRKEIIPADSNEHYVWNRKGSDFDDWKHRTRNSPTLYRPDPFGIESCFLDYSLNKKRRWKIPEEFGDRIEEIQDPYRNLRVSSSLHTVDHSHNLFIDLYMGNPIVDQPCNALYDVSRDGSTTTKKYSKTGKTNMRDFSTASNANTDSKNSKHKPLHIHYFAWEIADSNSLYNKRANKQRKDHSWNGISPRRPKYFNGRIDDDFEEY